MILVSVSNYNQFSQDYYDSLINSLQFHQLTCTCGRSASLSIHAYYRRGILLPDGCLSLRICRVRCSECGRTHSILPSSIVPYDRVCLTNQVTVIQAYMEGTDRNAICEDNPSVDENCVKAIIRRFLLFWLQRILSEAISLSEIRSLVGECFAYYSMQFMQIRRTAVILFPTTT